jgi:hypothetical protein
VREVNVINCELESELDIRGFRHRASALGRKLGACRAGAGVYDADEHACRLRQSERTRGHVAAVERRWLLAWRRNGRGVAGGTAGKPT